MQSAIFAETAVRRADSRPLVLSVRPRPSSAHSSNRDSKRRSLARSFAATRTNTDSAEAEDAWLEAEDDAWLEAEDDAEDAPQAARVLISITASRIESMRFFIACFLLTQILNEALSRATFCNYRSVSCHFLKESHMDPFKHGILKDSTNGKKLQ